MAPPHFGGGVYLFSPTTIAHEPGSIIARMNRDMRQPDQAEAAHAGPKRNLEYLGKYYEGSTVADYDRKRSTHGSWRAEQAALDDFLREISLPPGSAVVDVPVGTGRFLETYARLGFRVTGIDISTDMVATSRQRAAALGLQSATFAIGDATRLQLADKSVDLAVSVRFLNHLEFDTIRSVIAELARVSTRYLIVHARITLPEGDSSSLSVVINAFRRGAERLAAFAARFVKKKKVADRAATIHTTAAIREIFESAGLRILEDVVVNRRAHLGFEARMYLLAHDPARQS